MYWATSPERETRIDQACRKWPAYSVTAEQSMRVGETVETVPTPHKAELDFFDAYNAGMRKPR